MQKDKKGQPLSTINQNCKRTRKVNNYQQLTKIAEGKKGLQLSTITNNCDDHEWSTIINNYLKLQKEKEVNNYQPLPTIAMIMGGQQLFT